MQPTQRADFTNHPKHQNTLRHTGKLARARSPIATTTDIEIERNHKRIKNRQVRRRQGIMFFRWATMNRENSLMRRNRLGSIERQTHTHTHARTNTRANTGEEKPRLGRNQRWAWPERGAAAATGQYQLWKIYFRPGRLLEPENFCG